MQICTPTLEVGNALMTPPKSHLYMGSGDYLYPSGLHDHLPLDNAINKNKKTTKIKFNRYQTSPAGLIRRFPEDFIKTDPTALEYIENTHIHIDFYTCLFLKCCVYTGFKPRHSFYSYTSKDARRAGRRSGGEHSAMSRHNIGCRDSSNVRAGGAAGES
ncbi:hypothetical protein EVAR_8513_1 [Eumeta japonica]|uniref:Uncharacterized protein n=1 Tax=Eumeta variegata TaxID=151549 RepID=A0A4C1TXN8_EUMVA|nr:hypothetical protein EVAR_8513_1 [Eumeta japonica]